MNYLKSALIATIMLFSANSFAEYCELGNIKPPCQGDANHPIVFQFHAQGEKEVKLLCSGWSWHDEGQISFKVYGSENFNFQPLEFKNVGNKKAATFHIVGKSRGFGIAQIIMEPTNCTGHCFGMGGSCVLE